MRGQRALPLLHEPAQMRGLCGNRADAGIDPRQPLFHGLACHGFRHVRIERATEMLLAAIEGKPGDQRVELTTDLVVRRSTATPLRQSRASAG